MMRVIVLIGALALASISVTNSLSAGNQATTQPLAFATAAAPIPGGGFYIADASANKVYKVDNAGAISVLAGTGAAPSSDVEADASGTATSAKLDFPTDAVPTEDGGVLISDMGLNGYPRVRKVLSGNISTVAGGAPSASCNSDPAGNGCPPTQAFLSYPTAAVPFSTAAGGGFLIAEWNNNVVRKVVGGVINKVAGGGTSPGTCPGSVNSIGDGCQATQAVLSSPSAGIPFKIGGAAVDTSTQDPGTGFLITENQGCRVRFVNNSGVISTLVGQTTANPCRTSNDPTPPDSGMISSLKLSTPWDARPTATAGVFLLADGFACVVRRINTNLGTYTTPSHVDCSSGGMGITAAIPAPDDKYLVADGGNGKVQQADSNGSLTPVAGSSGNSSPPAISGTPAVGQTLTCSQGTWTNNPDTFSYQWNRDGSAIAAASTTTNTYVVAAADAGHAITCTVRATHTGSGGSNNTATATSSPVNIPAATSSGNTQTGGTTTGGGGGGGGTTTPKATCTFTKRSGVIPLSTPPRRRGSRIVPQPKNTLAIAVKCNQAARATIRGTLKQTIKIGRRTTTKSIALAARVLALKANVAVATTLNVPAAVVSAIKRGVKTSATLKLTAANANPATATIARLSTKR